MSPKKERGRRVGTAAMRTELNTAILNSFTVFLVIQICQLSTSSPIRNWMCFFLHMADFMRGFTVLTA